MAEPPRPESATKEGITVTRVFDAPRERVWKEWIEPERFADWFGGSESEVPLSTVSMDVRPGGSWRATMFASPGRREIHWKGRHWRSTSTAPTAGERYALPDGLGVTDVWWPFGPAPAVSRWSIKIAGEQTGGRLLQILSRDPRGTAPPLITFSPAGNEGPAGFGADGFFREVAVPVVPGRPPPGLSEADPEEFAGRMAQYGIEVVGPPPTLD